MRTSLKNMARRCVAATVLLLGSTMPSFTVPSFTVPSFTVPSFTVPVFAHHGGGVEYFMDRTQGPITGTVTSFAFTFPHPQVYFDVKDEKGTVTKWAAVLQLTPTALRARGWTRTALKPGDTIAVTYSPHRTAPNVGFARRIEVNGKFFDEGV